MPVIALVCHRRFKLRCHARPGENPFKLESHAQNEGFARRIREGRGDYLNPKGDTIFVMPPRWNTGCRPTQKVPR